MAETFRRVLTKVGLEAAIRSEWARGKLRNLLIESLRGSYEETTGQTAEEQEALKFQKALGVSLLPFLDRLVKEKPQAARKTVDFAFQWSDDMRKRLAFRQQGLMAPDTYVIEPTNRCNLHCPGCYAASIEKGSDLPYELIEKVDNEMRDTGVLEQLARGVYRLTTLPDFSEPDLVLVSKKISRGVICLISALAYYGITTQIPHFVYVAIPVNSRKPKLDYPPIRYFWYSEKVYQAGMKTIQIKGCPVKIYDIEKTLADCVKFRNKIGMDVVIEALKMYWRGKKTNLDKLYEYAKINRVEKILQPIMETIVSQ